MLFVNGIIYFCNVEKIYQHIEKLLGHNEYVVVPGLGGFVLQEQSASIVDGVISAPCKVISFNPLMHHADGLLVIEIARSEHVSYRVAQEMLSRETELLKQQLKTLGSYEFGNFGTFFQEGGSTITFVPNSNAAFIPSNIGLNDLLLPHNSVRHQQFTSNRQANYSAKILLRYAAVFALLMSMMFVSERRLENTDTQSAALINLSKLNSAVMRMATDTLKVAANELSQTQSGEEFEQPNDSVGYHVIVASLPTQLAADNYRKLLVDNNFATAHVLKPVKTYRVAIKSFASKSAAISFMEELRATDERFATAWVLCKQ